MDTYNFFFYYCPLFPLLLSPASSNPHSQRQSPPPQRQSPPLCPCQWVLSTCSFAYPFPLIPLMSPSPLPSGHCQFVLYFHVSASFSLVCLLCWLDSTYKSDDMVFVLHCLAYFMYNFIKKTHWSLYLRSILEVWLNHVSKLLRWWFSVY